MAMSWITAVIIIISVFVIAVLSAGLVYFFFFRYNLPIAILRYQGDKRRPQIAFTKGRRMVRAGVRKLFVKGYRLPVRDFEAKNYYPCTKGKQGALLLWEFKTGMLTPAIPAWAKDRTVKISKKDKLRIKKIKKAYGEVQEKYGLQPVHFEFDDALYKELLVKAIDDTDIDFMIQEIARVDQQYTTGWREFLAKYGGHALVAFVAILMFVGFVFFIVKYPEFTASCNAAAQEASTNVIEEFAKNWNAPPG